jgi:hypothetical protein
MSHFLSSQRNNFSHVAISQMPCRENVSEEVSAQQGLLMIPILSVNDCASIYLSAPRHDLTFTNLYASPPITSILMCSG